MLPGSQEKANDEFDRPWVCSLTAQQNRGFTAEPRALNFDPMEAQDLFKDISIGDRLRGAVMSQFVGDAAALGTHWIYNLTELQRLYPSGISGFEAPKEGHCHFGKEPGDQTHYGDSALVFLELGKQWKRRCTTSRWVLGVVFRDCRNQEPPRCGSGFSPNDSKPKTQNSTSRSARMNILCLCEIL